MDFTNGYRQYREGLVAHPSVASGSYYVSGQSGSRLDLFANGRGLFTSGGKTRDCYPDVYSTTVHGCHVFDDAGAVMAQFQFSPPSTPADSPANISGTVAGAAVVLYPN